MKTIIIGAGVTGLAAGYATGVEIFEATDEAGGLCKTRRMPGYMYEETGGKWIFGMTPKVERLFKELNIDWASYPKRSGVYLNKIIDGSFQNFALQNYIASPGSMKEFLVKRFGQELCNIFFFPFHERYTASKYEMVDPECEYKSPLRTNVETDYNSVFAYPGEGMKYLIDALAEKCIINYNFKVVEVNVREKCVVFETGEREYYDVLISTMPLCSLVRMIRSISCKPILPYVTTYVANIYGEKGCNYPSQQWLYVPYSRFYRIGFYNNVYRIFAPTGYCMIYAETTDPDCIPEYIIRELESNSIIKNGKVADAITIPIAYTYRYSNQNIQSILDELQENNIYSIGRYGKWVFQGIAESIMDGLAMKDRLC